MKKSFKCLILATFAAMAAQTLSAQAVATQLASGTVFEDSNGDGVFDATEKGVPQVRISNGRDIVTTDENGKYEIAVDDDDIVFLLKPKGWQVPMNEHQLPQFYYIHKPAGTPGKDKFPGVDPTGPLPEEINFPMHRQDEPETFRALLFGDPQPRNMKEVEYVLHDVVEEVIGTDASFGVTLGDIAFNDLDTLEPQNAGIALIGIPWYNVVGNHDINFSATEDRFSDETFERIYGPPYYSFDYGNVHFLVIDDVMFLPKTAERKKQGYTGGLGEEQLTFIENDLAGVPEDKLLVVMMHIPLTSGWHKPDREKLYRMMEDRPFTMSISAHTHYLEHKFLDKQDGWQGENPHHHFINVTVSGSWWSGIPDEEGIPHTTMRDGSPNGYSIIEFDGHEYSIDFKAARRQADYQMNIYAPEALSGAEAAKTKLVVNVFAGSEKSTVEFRVGDEGDWIPMKYAPQQDPGFKAMKATEEKFKTADGKLDLPGRKLPDLVNSSHIWEAPFPTNIAEGTYPIQVRTTDMFGKVYQDHREIRILK